MPVRPPAEVLGSLMDWQELTGRSVLPRFWNSVSVKPRDRRGAALSETETKLPKF